MRRVAYILDVAAGDGQTAFRLNAYPGTFTQVFIGGLLAPPSSYSVENNTLTLSSSVAPPEGTSVLVISGQGGSFVTTSYVDALAETLAKEESVAERFGRRHVKGEDVLLPRDPVDPLAAVPLQMLEALPEGAPRSYVDTALARYYLRDEADALLVRKISDELLGAPGGVALLGDSGLLEERFIPRLALGEPFVVETEAEMHALVASGTVEAGDVVRVAGSTPARVYMKLRQTAEQVTGTLSDFIELSDPTGQSAQNVSVAPTSPLLATNVQAFVEEYVARYNAQGQALRQEFAASDGVVRSAGESSVEAERTAREAHEARADNPHGVTALQAGAKPSNYVPTYLEVTGKPSTFPPTIGSTASTAVAGNDSRLTNARTPISHKSSHASGGADALTPADIGASTSVHAHDAIYPKGNPAGAENGQVWTYDATSGGWLPKTAAGAASETAAGITEQATQEEVEAGTAGNLFATVARLKAELDRRGPINAECELSRSTVQGIASNTLASVMWTVEVLDPRNWHDEVTNRERITPDAAGRYSGVAYIVWASSTVVSNRRVRILKWVGGAVTVIADSYIGLGTAAQYTTTGPQVVAFNTRLALGGYLVVEVFQNTGATLDMDAASTFSIARML